ncbi:hypothetical protein RRG08_046126 [Elysia crispata]|uniref:Uncharacterized protein n=1 Tax=Elysia crispata TaxID=231223 RepID=A0AAE0Y741_9GAST|nr:hypothetical protein RRG08_046126 [Elysia crispata]
MPDLKDSENIDVYWAEMRKLAKTCTFGAFEDDLIRDRIDVGINNEDIRRKLLKNIDLTLEKCIDTIMAMEIAALSNVDCESLAEPVLRKCRRKLLLEKNPGPSKSGLIDTALSRLKTIHSSMAVTADSSTSPIKVLEQSIESFHIKKDMNTPLTEEEERAASFLVRKILAHSENKDILKLKTRGQPLYFQRINKPRKSSDKAGSPLKRKRSEKILKLWSIVSGETKEA